MRDVLRVPGALPLFVASCVARLPMGAVSLLLVLHTQDVTGSYAHGGLASAVYALGLGLSNPALARLVDHRGQTLVLRLGAVIAALAIAGLAILPAGAPFAGILVLAAVAGAAQPPVGACMRAIWPELLDGQDARHAAYSLESVVLEVVYICGPLVIVAGIGSWSMAAALASCAIFLLAGDLAFSAQPASRHWRPHDDRPRNLIGALRGGGVLVLVGVFALCGLAVGAVEVAVPAGLDEMGHRGLTGIMLGLWGLGSMVGGIIAARSGAPRDAPRRLAMLLFAWGVAHAAVGIAAGPWALAALLTIAGVTIAPTFVCANGMLDQLAPAGTLTEAFTWTSTGMTAGIAAGSALTGALVEVTSPGLSLALLGGGGVVAALVVHVTAGGALRSHPAAA